ncbi:MAG: hypothetical protein ED559_04175 [Phycisphaera sp.]|nr:MAG: hypothetical protein ED559_04175 [Phycisphaera sp.]
MVLVYLKNERLVNQPDEVRDHWIRSVVDSVILSTDSIQLSLDADGIRSLHAHEFDDPPEESPGYPVCPFEPIVEDSGKLVRLTLKIQIKKLDGRRVLLSPSSQDLVIPSRPEPKPHIVRAIGLAYRWHQDLVWGGMQIREYANANSIARMRILKLLPLTQLSPEILKRALTGALPDSITLNDLLAASTHLNWKRQSEFLGLSTTSRD